MSGCRHIIYPLGECGRPGMVTIDGYDYCIGHAETAKAAAQRTVPFAMALGLDLTRF